MLSIHPGSIPTNDTCWDINQYIIIIIAWKLKPYIIIIAWNPVVGFVTWKKTKQNKKLYTNLIINNLSLRVGIT